MNIFDVFKEIDETKPSKVYEEVYSLITNTEELLETAIHEFAVQLSQDVMALQEKLFLIQQEKELEKEPANVTEKPPEVRVEEPSNSAQPPSTIPFKLPTK